MDVMTIPKMVGTATLVAVLALPALAATPTAKMFVAKAGAGDLFELREAAIMSTSSDPAVAAFAKQMTKDHTDSTNMVNAAAKSDGMTPGAPMLTAKQTQELGALRASTGKARDALYVNQQKAAHAEALALMKDYAANGSAAHLKATAGKIEPVVQGHIGMLDKM
jgi:putative membrane protein